ncbi:ADP-ribosylglycohydrolase family protein [Nakamurella endophytica]|uniref:ADP-ribosylglycohydrolase family protein n=1 Tax=Nakamurella endophytica TaxID=1748367 RepID=A0A917WM84_9ACTN|nr:ADP-ribosylglycohydrolase family protein [Nakamurella endophytica]GGM13889.1 hypothetical protein GCM10011594_37190 [Nakamurella endophytica]
MRLTWVQPEDSLLHEFEQAAHEGKEVEDLRRRWLDAGGAPAIGRNGATPEPPAPELVALARRLLAELDARPVAAAYAAAEPRDLAAILATLATPPAALPVPGAAELARRTAGAWTGRLVGCLVGKVVEKVPRAGIEALLRSSGQWPLRGYITAAGVPAEVSERYPWNRASRVHSMAENIDGMPEDDDINYSLLALALVERRGRALTTEDVADSWLRNLPAALVFTAERAAYRNLLDALPVEQVPVTANPFREWIGAAIRTDVYGWVCPGRPAEAAELAWRDGRLSHTGSGLYSAMANAAMAAAAVAGAGPDAVLEAGRSVVPPRSTLAAAIDTAVDLGHRGLTDEQGLGALYERFGHLHWVHAVNNAALVCYAVARHGTDFDRAVALTAVSGWDTDSTGATVGGLVGAVVGPEGIADRWTDPIGGRVASSLPGFADARVPDLVRRTVELAGQPS